MIRRRVAKFDILWAICEVGGDPLQSSSGDSKSYPDMWWTEEVSDIDGLAEKNLVSFKTSRLQMSLSEVSYSQDETLCSKIPKKRLRWFGHVERMEEHRLPCRVLRCFIEGKRSRGRQTKTWMDNIKEDLKTKNLNIRTDLIRDKTRWRTLVQTHRQPSWWEE